jgi:hypothetical protein
MSYNYVTQPELELALGALPLRCRTIIYAVRKLRDIGAYRTGGGGERAEEASIAKKIKINNKK